MNNSWFQVLVLSWLCSIAVAWTTPASSSRRDWMKQVSSYSAAALISSGTVAATASPAWAVDTGKALEELEQSIEKMKPIPDLLDDNEWDKVRSILKQPPVNKLWNLGDSQNTLLQLARETGNIDLFELKDDLAYNLQLCDQLTYDNAFVYFQPGNGKVNIKEPKEFSKKAMKQIQQAIDLAKE
mmetsp:Transcript_1756/g.3847  ORF Transcript_1756/g.3847 Transcript_1756/m.3847 type:complete len:184 (+) Transcript_1756:214-765(+)